MVTVRPAIIWEQPPMDIDHFLSYTVEWMLGLVEKGDIVIIEFGHFEGGGPMGSIRTKVLCPGLDTTETCEGSVVPITPLIDRKLTLVIMHRPSGQTVLMEKCFTPSSSKFFSLTLPSSTLLPGSPIPFP